MVRGVGAEWGPEWGRSVNFTSHGAWSRCGVGGRVRPEWGRSVNFTWHGVWSRCGVGDGVGTERKLYIAWCVE